MSRQVKIAVVQPQSYLRGIVGSTPGFFDEGSPREEENLDVAAGYVAEAAATGARFVAFPEMYPGPSARAGAWPYAQTIDVMAECARRHGVHVLFGGVERDGAYTRNVYTLVGPGDEPPASYAKVVPACGEPSLPGDRPLLVRTPDLSIGLLICWEAWYPELARTLALQGADIIFYPTGGALYDLHDSWRAILQARAAENTVYVASCVNIFGVEPGLAYIFSPERQEAALLETGMACATVDLDRLRYLRTTDEQLITPKKYRSIPGVLRSLRPEVVELYHQAATEALQRGTAGQYVARASWGTQREE